MYSKLAAFGDDELFITCAICTIAQLQMFMNFIIAELQYDGEHQRHARKDLAACKHYTPHTTAGLGKNV